MVRILWSKKGVARNPPMVEISTTVDCPVVSRSTILRFSVVLPSTLDRYSHIDKNKRCSFQIIYIANEWIRFLFEYDLAALRCEGA